MVVRSKSVGGIFQASNTTQIVDMLSAPAAMRGNRLLGVNFTGLDANDNNDRCILALSMGRIDPEREAGGAYRNINVNNVLAEGDFLNVFAHGAVTGGHASGGPVEQSHYVTLHGLTVVEQVDLLVYLPNTTVTLQWYCDLYYEPVRMSQSAWAELRHRPPVEHRAIGDQTV